MKVGIYFIVLGSFVLFVWFYSAFWPVVNAEVTEVTPYHFYQAGYAKGNYTNAYSGGGATVSLAHYSYLIDGHVFNGKGITSLTQVSSDKYEPIAVRYFPLYRGFSFSSRGACLLLGLMLLFLGIGMRQVRLWALRWLNAKH